NTLRSTHSTYPSVHAVGLAEPCAKTNRRRPPQPALCPKAPAALKPAAKIAKTHPPQTQICHGISAREKCRLNGARDAQGPFPQEKAIAHNIGEVKRSESKPF